MNPYETLGIPPDATEDEVKKAFKREAREAHPDREGGDTERFQAIVTARDILVDPKRRERCDHTGQTDKPSVSPAEEHLFILLEAFVSQEKFSCDIIATARDEVNRALARIGSAIAKTTKTIERLEKNKNRVSTKAKSNIFRKIVEDRLESHRASIKKMEYDHKLMTEVLGLLEDYNDDVPEQESPGWTVTGGMPTTGAW